MNTISAWSLARWLPLAVARPAGGQAGQLLQRCVALLRARAVPVRAVAARALPPATASLEISPLVAAAGVSRRISITSFWPLGCVPAGMRVVEGEAASPATLVIRMESVGRVSCVLPLLPHQHVVDFTPMREGDLPVRVISSDGEVIAGQARIRTRNLGGSFSQFDISGRWREATGGDGGLTLNHRRIRSRCDDVTGTWLLNDANGQSRCYAIDDVTWQEGGMQAEGTLYETVPGAGELPTRTTQLGRVRIVLRTDRSARVYAIGFRGGILFMSNLERMAS